MRVGTRADCKPTGLTFNFSDMEVIVALITAAHRLEPGRGLRQTGAAVFRVPNGLRYLANAAGTRVAGPAVAAVGIVGSAPRDGSAAIIRTFRPTGRRRTRKLDALFLEPPRRDIVLDVGIGAVRRLRLERLLRLERMGVERLLRLGRQTSVTPFLVLGQ